MAEQKFKTGDQVILNSGGPVMTVIKYEHDEVICQWFQGGKLEEKAFHQDAISKYSAKFF